MKERKRCYKLAILTILSCFLLFGNVYATEISNTSESSEPIENETEELFDEDDIENDEFEEDDLSSEMDIGEDPDKELNSNVNISALFNNTNTDENPIYGIHIAISNYDSDISYDVQLNEENGFSAVIPICEGTYDVNANVTSDFSKIYNISLDGVETGSIQVGDTTMNTGYYIEIEPNSEYDIVANIMRNENAEITDTNLAPELPSNYKEIVSGKYSESKAQESMSEENTQGSMEEPEDQSTINWLYVVISIVIIIIAICLGLILYIKRIRDDEDE